MSSITAALFLPPLLENLELPKGTKHDRERIRKQSGGDEELDMLEARYVG
jgi:hypothetical protein